MRFEQVLNDLHRKPLKKMATKDLRQHLENIRNVRTDIPDTKQRRQKRKSSTYQVDQIATIAKKLGYTVEELMELPEVLEILGGDDNEGE